MSFAALQHSRPRGSTSHGFCLPAMFRPQGLATLSTVYSPQGPVGSVSRQRRSWASPFGACPPRRYPHVAAREHPPTVLASVETDAEAPARPPGPRFLGFDPPASSCRAGLCLARRHAEAPLGFSLPGHSGDGLVPDFAGTPHTRLAISCTKPEAACASEYQSTVAWSDPLGMQALCHGPNSPLRVSAPLELPTIRAPDVPGYGFTSRRPDIADRGQRSLERLAPCRS